MPLSTTETLYNASLDLIGEYQVTAGDTTSKQAEACIRNYSKARDEVLRNHLWNEATKRSCVLQESTAPIHGYNYKFQIPTDCLRIVSIGTDLREWKVEAGYILTDYIKQPDEWAEDVDYVEGQYVSLSSVTYLCNESHTSATATSPATDTTTWTTQSGDYGYIELEYVYQLTDIASFSPQLYNAIVYKLAIKIVTSLTGDMKNKTQLMAEFEQLVMPQARSIDAMQGTPRIMYNSLWKRSRY